jgi:antitoxin component of MazEF toxin-antitoxin module
MYKNRNIPILDDNSINQLEYGATRKLRSIGYTVVVTIPKSLFNAKYWEKTDKINVLVINDDTVIIHNPQATKRLNQYRELREQLLEKE